MASFDEMAARIEAINYRLHDPSCSVQEKADLFCEAVTLVRECKKKLVHAHERFTTGRELMERK